MIRQPSKPDKMYSVEVYDSSQKGSKLLVANPCVYAQKPLDAVVYAMNAEGYGRSRNNVAPYDGKSNTSLMVAKVCLLGGRKESVSYYEVG